MQSKKKLLLFVLLFVLLLGGAYVLYTQMGATYAPNRLAVTESVPAASVSESTASAPETTSPKVPDFTVYDREGNPVQLSDFLGKPIVLNFWASWCVPCQTEMPDFQEKFLEYEDQIQFLMVNMTDGSKETVHSASTFVDEERYTFPVYYDTAFDAAMTYRVYSMPTTYFIGADGSPVAQAPGMIDADTLQQGIEMLLP